MGTSNLSIFSQSIKYRLRIAFYLVCIIPLLLLCYIMFRYGIMKNAPFVDWILILSSTALIIVLGFFLIKDIFERVLLVNKEVKDLVNTEIKVKVDTENGDEVNQLAKAVTTLTEHIRTNMEELKIYSEKTTLLNLQIQKRMLLFSGLLEISSLLSQGAPLNDVLKIITEKVRLLTNADAAFILFFERDKNEYYVRVADGISSSYLLSVRIGQDFGRWFNILSGKEIFILDEKNGDEELAMMAYEKLRLRNFIIAPVLLKEKQVAVLCVGNCYQHFSYQNEDKELMEIFIRQIGVAVENDALLRQVERLEIKDALTGLYNERYINNRLDEEIRRAIYHQRPCAFVLLDIDNFKSYYDNFGSRQSEVALKRISDIVLSVLTPLDKAGRIADDQFAVILPEKTKRQAYTIAEDIRRRIEQAFLSQEDARRRLTVSGAVSENPLDGTSAQDLYSRATQLLAIAKSKGKNCVVF